MAKLPEGLDGYTTKVVYHKSASACCEARGRARHRLWTTRGRLVRGGPRCSSRRPLSHPSSVRPQRTWVWIGAISRFFLSIDAVPHKPRFLHIQRREENSPSRSDFREGPVPLMAKQGVRR